ncbi:MAG: peptidoglycan D,D-transpeptidase FtsI family protein [Phototrophicaceae bacterium]|jgi:cell division protein FtsI/penicillin-binding protein 2
MTQVKTRYGQPDVQDSLKRRLPLVSGLMGLAALYLLAQLVTFQYQPTAVTNYYNRLATFNYVSQARVTAGRGVIYDREGQPLANNTFDYEIGMSPNLITDITRVAPVLADALSLRELEIKTVYDAAVANNLPWVSLAKPVSPTVAERIRELKNSDQNLLGITVDSQARRLYPQGTLGAQVLGFVAGDAVRDLSLRGYNGIEGYYENELAGGVRDETFSRIPFELPEDRNLDDRGSDLVLTIDRDVQFLIESELQRAVTETGATGGTIIVMDPRTGDILGMTSYPSFDPNTVYAVNDPNLLRNPAISDAYEPGSVMKLVTMAAGLEKGVILPTDTYVDNGVIEVGGVMIPNSDRAARGVVDMTQIIVQSLNVGATNISLKLGPSNFYEMIDLFGFGRSTGVDLEGEAIGTVLTPYDADWSESNLATNSFGQGISVTPLQMVTAVSAIANDGLMMQPHIVQQVIDGNEVYPSVPSALGRPISAETANIVTEMMVQAVEQNLTEAQLPGYRVAGKSGTAEIPTPLGYERDASIASFIGFLPADAPQVIIFVKLDRPNGYWGSLVAAPVFRRIAERLVILMELPSDNIRQALAAEGGNLNNAWSR